MPTPALAKTKNGYQTMLWTYLDRKKKIQAVEGRSPRVQKMEDKIATFRRAIKRIESKNKSINQVRILIKEFMGVDVMNIPRHPGKGNATLPRNIFYKYCVESGIISTHVSRYLGFCSDACWNQRRVFTKSFATNKENKEMYHRFLQFVKRKENASNTGKIS